MTSTQHFLCMLLYICDRHCTSNIAINISIFHLGLIRGARAYCPDAVRPHPLLKPLPTGATGRGGGAGHETTPGPSCELTCLCSSGIAPHV